MMHFKDKFFDTKGLKSFTLVELIIVITILAILSVSAFLVVSQWIGKSRDSRRLSDLGTIQRALEVSLTENPKYPTPDSAVNITAGLIIIGQQGKFGDSATAATDIKSTPKDPLDNVAYTYYVATGGKNYQVMGFLENSSILTFRGIEAQGPRSTVSDQENLQFSNSACTCNSNGTNSICSAAFFASLAFCLNYAHASEVSAADYSVRVPTVKGETLGILILSGTNQPVEELGSTVDLNTITSSLIAVFSNADKSSGTGGMLLPQISIKNVLILSQPLFSSIDPSLLGYWDMETLTTTGALRDFSKYNNHGTIYGSQATNGVKGKGFKFDGVDDYIDVGKVSDWTSTGLTMIAWAQKGVNNGGFFDILDNQKGGFRINLRIAWTANNIIALTQNNFSGTTQDAISTGSVINKRYHIAATIDLSTKKLVLYVDGKKIGETSVSIPVFYGTVDTNNMFIGKHGSAYDEYFNGLIDEIRIYNRVLSESEIQILYANNR